jgi:FMN phosphatase YigB (HAD superfamily)
MQHVKDSLVPVDESFAIVSYLAGRGIPLYGLSNMSATMFDHLRNRYDCWDVFRGIVISGEVKMIKPDPQIFEHITKLYRLVPSDTVFIDDNPPNIEAADRHGFRTILFTGANQCARDLNALT